MEMEHRSWTAALWEGFHGRTDFVFASPLVHLFHPCSGKGYALLKPAGTARYDKTKDRWAEPFLEWLRYRGYFNGTAGWFTSRDLRLFCPIPSDLSYDQLSTAVTAFRNLRLGGTAAKIDCRAVLGLTRILIESSSFYCRPRQLLRGLHVTHYKDMGQAHALMAVEQLAIPDWFELQSAQQAKRWLAALAEHDTVVRRLNDSHSDELALIQQYRNTFQIRQAEAMAQFVEFLAGYGILLFNRRTRDGCSLRQFTDVGAGAILKVDPSLRGVLENPGFVAVAGAIRGSTIGAQAARNNGSVDHREIRYGLLGDLRRTGLLGRRMFLEQVSAFIAAFNREAAGRHSVGMRAARIRANEWEAFAALIDSSAPDVPVASLLGAFACCLPAAVAVEREPELCGVMTA
jgi:hypothetical protein